MREEEEEEEDEFEEKECDGWIKIMEYEKKESSSVGRREGGRGGETSSGGEV